MPQAQTTRLVAGISSQLGHALELRTLTFFICVYASMYFFLSVLLSLTTFTAMTARDDVGRFALLTNVDCDTVPGPRLQRPGQPRLQGHRRQWRQHRAGAELQPGGGERFAALCLSFGTMAFWPSVLLDASILVDQIRAGCLERRATSTRIVR